MAEAVESSRSGGLCAVLLGAPGSGKGTQAEFLATALGVPAISTGAMLRDAVAHGSELGRKVESIMAAGALVDDGLMAEVVRDRLSRPDAAGGFLLDGYPRTTGQAATSTCWWRWGGIGRCSTWWRWNRSWKRCFAGAWMS